MSLELADIFRRYGESYRQKYASRMPITHLKAMRAIERDLYWTEKRVSEIPEIR